MNCYECAIHGESVPAVATCTHCGIGMCLEHFQAEQDYRLGGTTYGCRHDMGTRPRVSAPTHSNGHSLHWHRAAK
jgi:hypothetical protein